MVITGSGIFIEPNSDAEVIEKLKDFPGVTYQAASESGTELVVNLEAEDHHALEDLCAKLRQEIPQIVDIGHMYVNFEEEVEKIKSGKMSRSKMTKPKFGKQS